MEKPRIFALIVAAGRGSRLSEETPKQYLPLAGIPMLTRTLSPFLSYQETTGIQVVISPNDVDYYNNTTADFSLLPPVYGGRTRQDSVRLGLEALLPHKPDYVLIHDAARPFISHRLISSIIEELKSSKTVLPALPLHDTVKSLETGSLTTKDRTHLYSAQTPQGFDYTMILELHRAAIGQTHTDDVSLCEKAGIPVALVAGERLNQKITTDEDRQMAEFLLSREETRIAHGIDVHRFIPWPEGTASKEIMLAGVPVPCAFAIDAHSDGDVVLHALTDALLGIAGGGDIGTFFPPSDPQWKGASSDIFLEFARDKVIAQGGRIINVDITILAETPKIMPHKERMIARLSTLLMIDASRITIKATTTEGLGAIGRKEGIMAQSVVSVGLPLTI